ncbi:Sortilin-related receptor [Labeo rohita]|uniref:Sortilin-related receptor n=1 Tax=Labeo rohita TaxID=84645 RepID=A0ABQ8M209_LABRO|nr:Sortilin-related receptor [Labeo rohita]
MRAAQFNTRHPITEYYIADASEDQVFVCVNHNNNVTHLYISDTQGLAFSLSLENVLYYSPEGSGSNTLISFPRTCYCFTLRQSGISPTAKPLSSARPPESRDAITAVRNADEMRLARVPYFANEPFADLHRVEGLRGVFVATLINGSVTEDNMRSVITFDKGGTWELLQPPAADSLGGTIDCQLDNGCSLHLAQRWSQLLNIQLRRIPILSKESAPGLIMATGSVGKNLANKPNVYVSSSAGVRWREALAGPHFYTWGDHGGILMAIAQGGSTRTLKFSTNEGETWKEFQFSEQERGNGCLLGREMVYKRRSPHATCFNGEDFDRPVTLSNCSCTRQDYECDYGFKLSEDLSLEVCVPDPEFSGNLYAPPVPCPVGTTYRRSKGYRKVSGDSCSGGDVEARLDGELLPCPVGESNEFILYAVRSSIHRYDLATGTDQPLPLSGLHEAVALDFDYEKNCLLCLNGSSGQEVIVKKDLQNVEALSFDPISRLLYWVDAGAQKIEVSNSDGDLRRTLVNSSVVEQPRALTLMPGESLMFWTDWGDRAAGIYRGWMDGSNISCIVSEAVRWPNGITADESWLYWTEAYGDRIERADFNGGHRTVIMEGLPHPYAIAVFKNDLYWDDWSRMGIFKAPKSGSPDSEMLVGRLTGVMDLKIFYKGKNRGQNACVDQPCSLLCLPQPGNKHHCVCPDGVSTTILPSGERQCQCPSGYQLRNNTCVKTEHTCLPNQHRCANGKCISSIWKCDSDNDCGDMSDEQECPTTSCDSAVQFRCVASESHKCGPGEFTCARGVCIRDAWRCDGDNDCRDWSDEANCTVGHHTCESSSFQCHTGHCIPQRWVCDGDDDCQDGSDEDPNQCGKDKCNGFLCSNGTCLPASAHCNGVEDCPGGADEQNCGPLCAHYMEFVCRNRAQCLFQSLVCDGTRHCADGSDEDPTYAGCSTNPEFEKTCDAYSFQCSNGMCVTLEWKCDGMDDCGDYSDEANCASPTDEPGCSRYFQYECKNGRCVPAWWKCDGENDCGDWSDESQCSGGGAPHTPAPGPATCAPNRFRCGSGACIVNTWVCDGYADCPDGSDEVGCPTAKGSVTPVATPPPSGRCTKDEFLCQKPPSCIPDWKRCDGHPHCQDGSDEDNCPTHGPLVCVNGTLCADGEACVLNSERCDGFIDCSDRSDEDNCTTDLLVYKIQNLQWSANFSGAVTLTWTRPKNMPTSTCSFVIYFRQVGVQQWTSMDTNSNKGSAVLTVLMPDTTYQVKVQTQCLSKQHRTNEVLTLRTPEGLPDPPQNLQLSSDNAEDGTVLCSWNPPDKTHGLIREYIVEYNEKDSAEWFSQRSTITNAEVKNLQPSSLYRFRVAAVTSRGVGNWTEIKSITPQKALSPPAVEISSITENSMILSITNDYKVQVEHYVVTISWVFDEHVKESWNYTVSRTLKVSNLTAGMVYEVAVWAHTNDGDSPTALPHRVNTTSSSLTVIVDSDKQYLFLVRVIIPYLGPPSDYAVVKMIPNERLPPRNLHKVRVDKTQATLKWQPPYDSPSSSLTYAVHVRDTVRKTEWDYKVSTQNNTVEYTLKGLEPGGRYSITILEEQDHVFLFWKSLAVKDRTFNESRGYEVYMHDSVTNSTKCLGNTTETFFRISNLLVGHNYTFSVRARCLLNNQLCGEAAVLLYDELGKAAGMSFLYNKHSASLSLLAFVEPDVDLDTFVIFQGQMMPHLSRGKSEDMAAVVVPVLFLLLVGVCGGLVVLYLRHRRLQHSFTAFANSHYNSRLGSAIFSSGDELGDDDEDAPMISGFSDDVPMLFQKRMTKIKTVIVI